MFEFKYSETVDGRAWSDHKASKATLSNALALTQDNTNVRFTTEHAVLFGDGSYSVYEDEDTARAVALGKQAQFDMRDKATSRLKQAPVYARRRVATFRSDWEISKGPEWSEVKDRCDFYSTDPFVTRRTRDDGWRCGEEQYHKRSHVLYSADGESTLYSEGWERRGG